MKMSQGGKRRLLQPSCNHKNSVCACNRGNVGMCVSVCVLMHVCGEETSDVCVLSVR